MLHFRPGAQIVKKITFKNSIDFALLKCYNIITKRKGDKKMITAERVARLERMFEQRANFYNKKWKETHDGSYLSVSMAYNNAVLLLLYAESEQDDMINQFDYFTDENYYKGLDI